MSLAIFLPTRKGSERVKNKNTRSFAGFDGGLLELKLTQLQKLNVDEVILSTNDEASMEIAQNFSNFSNLRIIERPNHLALSSTSLQDLITYVPTITDKDHIMWTHVTSPLVNESIYNSCLEKYDKIIKEGFDSLMSVTVLQNFLWDTEQNDIINRIGAERWPRTQDLKKLYEINSAVFITPRDIFIKAKDRVGKRPFLYEMSEIESKDVDWEDDFLIAETLYRNSYG